MGTNTEIVRNLCKQEDEQPHREDVGLARLRHGGFAHQPLLQSQLCE